MKYTTDEMIIAIEYMDFKSCDDKDYMCRLYNKIGYSIALNDLRSTLESTNSKLTEQQVMHLQSALNIGFYNNGLCSKLECFEIGVFLTSVEYERDYVKNNMTDNVKNLINHYLNLIDDNNYLVMNVFYSANEMLNVITSNIECLQRFVSSNDLDINIFSAYKKMYELNEYSDSNKNGILLHGVYTQLPHIITILYEIRNKIVTSYRGKMIIVDYLMKMFKKYYNVVSAVAQADGNYCTFKALLGNTYG